MKIRAKLAFFYALIYLTMISSIGIILHESTKQVFEKNTYSKFNQFIDPLKNYLELDKVENMDNLKNLNFNGKILAKFNREFFDHIWIAIYDNKMKLLHASNLAKQFPLDKDTDLDKKHFNYVFKNAGYHTDFIANKHNDIYAFIRSYKIINNDFYYYIVIVIPVTLEIESLKKIRNLIFISFMILFILTNFVGFIFTGYTLLPGKKITRSINNITKEDLSRRIKVKNSKDEIGALATAVNGLLERLENSFNMEKQFISDISHEFKTPLSVMRLTIENIINDSNLNDDEIEKLGSVIETIYSMDFLVKKLLYLSKLEQNVFPFHPEKINIVGTVKKAFNNLKTLAEAKSLKYKFKSDNKDIFILGDDELLYLSVYNIIENALKYTEKGSITVHIYNNEDKIEIKISDTGIGIPADKINNIYDKFYRINPARNDKKGYGIGLSITKRIIDLHNGTIEVNSTPGKITEFTIKLKA